MMGRLTAGVAQVDISPVPGIELAGYPHHPRHNQGIHDPLYAGCICLEDESGGVALVCLDLLMYSRREVRALREQVARETGIPAASIMVCCSHTHSGPWTSGRLDLGQLSLAPDAAYLAELRRKLAALVREAWENRFEARVGVAKGYCGREQGVGGNRHDPREAADPEVWVIGVKDGKGTLRACMTRYALHPTFLHSDNLQVSADYPGCVRRCLADKHPGMVFLFGQGPSGNQSPRYFRAGKTYDEARRVGNAIGEEAARVLSAMDYRDDLRLTVRSAEVDLELRALPTRAEAQRGAAETRAAWEREKSAGRPEPDVWNAELRFLGAEDLLGYVLAVENGEPLLLRDDELPAEVQVLGIGEARIVGLPGELFAELGMTIQYRAPFDSTLVLELANGCLPGYACTARAYAQGGYEAGTSMLSARAGEQLVETAVKLLWLTKD